MLHEDILILRGMKEGIFMKKMIEKISNIKGNKHIFKFIIAITALLIVIAISLLILFNVNNSTSFNLPERKGDVLYPNRDEKYKDKLIIGAGDLIGSFDAITASASGDKVAAGILYESLLTYDVSGKPVNCLAENYDIKNNGKTYVFTLKKGVVFSDGTPLTAEDVRNNYLALSNVLYLADSVYNCLYDLEDFSSDDSNGIEIVDDMTISFTFKQTRASNIQLFTLGIQKSSFLNEMFSGNGTQEIPLSSYIGTGPYKISSGSFNQRSVEMTVNENYHGTKPNIKDITLIASDVLSAEGLFKNGELDITDFIYTERGLDILENNSYVSLYSTPGALTNYVGINCKHELLSDVNIRKAMAKAIDTKSIINEIYKGYATVSAYPYNGAFYGNPSNSFHKLDVSGAEKLLSKSGYNKGTDGICEKDGKKLSFKLDIYNSSQIHEIAEMIKQDLNKIGIEIEVVPHQYQELVDKVFTRNSFDLYFMTWEEGIWPDITRRFGKTEDGQNPEGWFDDALLDLVGKAEIETDIGKLKTYLQEIAKRYSDEVPQIPIATPKNMIMASSALKGLKPSPYLSIYWNIEEFNMAK